MEVNSITPAFTGRRLRQEEVNKLIKNNWTIPLGVDSVKFSKKSDTPKFFNQIAEFFKGLFK